MSQPTLYLPNQPVPELDGISAGIMRGNDETLYCLIIPNDPATDIPGLEWGSYGINILEAVSSWDGLANTRALLDTDHELPAVAAIARLNGDNETHPLYLPSQRELALCWATVPHLFRIDDWYWSSTQCSASSAWYQSFDYGSQYIDNEYTTGRVRAVRRLIIQ